MDFDQMLAIWDAQNTAPPFQVNHAALRQALQGEEARVRDELRTRRRELWFSGIIGTAMAVWAGFWIAITITNRWDAMYVVTSAISLVLFALAAAAMWMSRGRKPQPNFGNTLEDEVRRNLVYVGQQLSHTRLWITPIVGTACLIVGVGLFSWTVSSSQEIEDASSPVGWFWFTVIFVAFIVSGSFKAREEKRKEKSRLELRQRRLRELLTSLDARE